MDFLKCPILLQPIALDPLKLSGFTGRKRCATLLGHLTDVPFFVNENIGQKILSKDLENIVKKVASGKTLTSAERSLVEKAYGTSRDVKFAKTIVELSEILGVSIFCRTGDSTATRCLDFSSSQKLTSVNSLKNLSSYRFISARSL